MKINKIKIQNFQCHKDLEIVLNPDLTVIYGDTSTGKSAFFKSLEWLFNCSDVSENDYRREGSKETSVKIWLNSGFAVERIRSNSINRYILSKDGCEDKIWDSFGRDLPEEIQTVLGIAPIKIDKESLNLNFASQDQLNFILDNSYSDTFKAKLFNVLTGNELLDTLYKEINREGLAFGREIKELEETTKQQEEDLTSSIKKHKELSKKYNLVKTKFNDILKDVEIYENLKDLSQKLYTICDKTNELNARLKNIKTISDNKIEELKEEAKRLEGWKELSNELEAINTSIAKLEKKKEVLKICDVNFDDLKKEAESLQNLKQLNIVIASNNEKQKELEIDLEATNTLIQKDEKKLKKLWKECDYCPLCKQKVTK